VNASKLLVGPPIIQNTRDKDHIIDDLGKALYAAIICTYAQGLAIIKSASDANSWDINLAGCVRLWKGGCIIRAAVLDKIQVAFTSNPYLPNLMVDPAIAIDLNSCLVSWRNVVITCANHGIPCPTLGGTLAYLDSYRTASLPANLTQAQRDFFGGHTYERVDAVGPHHCSWTDAHKDIGIIGERTKGEK
jgi:6-phosphogluconate dehydrogenase